MHMKDGFPILNVRRKTINYYFKAILFLFTESSHNTFGNMKILSVLFRFAKKQKPFSHCPVS